MNYAIKGESKTLWWKYNEKTKIQSLIHNCWDNIQPCVINTYGFLLKRIFLLSIILHSYFMNMRIHHSLLTSFQCLHLGKNIQVFYLLCAIFVQLNFLQGRANYDYVFIIATGYCMECWKRLQTICLKKLKLWTFYKFGLFIHHNI